MWACIRRGASEVGGSCVELVTDGGRLVLDLGLPRSAAPDEAVSLPPVPGLVGGDAEDLVGLVLSHAHLDHYGLLDQVQAKVPTFAGQATARILREAAFFSPAGAELDLAGVLADRVPLRIGPFTVTPRLADHSAYDADSVVVEAAGLPS